MSNYFETPAKRIGKHDWRCVVKESTRSFGRVTEYQFRKPGEFGMPDTVWQPETEWPSYNSHDGTYAGLPHSLRDLYFTYQVEILAALNNQPVPAPAQQSLFA